MKNIQVLLIIKEMAERAGFITEEIEKSIGTSNKVLGDLIDSEDDMVMDLIEQIHQIDRMLACLTEDLKNSISQEAVDCKEYETLNNNIEFDEFRLTKLIDEFKEAHKSLIFYIDETVSGFRILTQESYGADECFEYTEE